MATRTLTTYARDLDVGDVCRLDVIAPGPFRVLKSKLFVKQLRGPMMVVLEFASGGSGAVVVDSDQPCQLEMH